MKSTRYELSCSGLSQDLFSNVLVFEVDKCQPRLIADICSAYARDLDSVPNPIAQRRDTSAALFISVMTARSHTHSNVPSVCDFSGWQCAENSCQLCEQ